MHGVRFCLSIDHCEAHRRNVRMMSCDVRSVRRFRHCLRPAVLHFPVSSVCRCRHCLGPAVLHFPVSSVCQCRHCLRPAVLHFPVCLSVDAGIVFILQFFIFRVVTGSYFWWVMVREVAARFGGVAGDAVPAWATGGIAVFLALCALNLWWARLAAGLSVPASIGPYPTV
jgi:hypothetical protein